MNDGPQCQDAFHFDAPFVGLPLLSARSYASSQSTAVEPLLQADMAEIRGRNTQLRSGTESLSTMPPEFL